MAARMIMHTQDEAPVLAKESIETTLRRFWATKVMPIVVITREKSANHQTAYVMLTSEAHLLTILLPNGSGKHPICALRE